jgi:hypothetical protein
MFKADINQTLLYGLILSIPAILMGGPLLARFFRRLNNQPPPHLYQHRKFRPEELPGLRVSLFTILIPVLLMLSGAVVTLSTSGSSSLVKTAKFLADPNVALLLAVFAGFYSLGIRRGRDMESLMKSVVSATASVSMLLLIIGAGADLSRFCWIAELRMWSRPWHRKHTCLQSCSHGGWPRCCVSHLARPPWRRLPRQALFSPSSQDAACGPSCW